MKSSLLKEIGVSSACRATRRWRVSSALVGVVLAALLGAATQAQAAIYNAVQNGNWSDPATWGEAVNTPGSGDTAHINGYDVVYDAGASGVIQYITTNASGKLTNQRSLSVSQLGHWHYGVWDLNDYTFTCGYMYGSGTITNIGAGTSISGGHDQPLKMYFNGPSYMYFLDGKSGGRTHVTQRSGDTTGLDLGIFHPNNVAPFVLVFDDGFRPGQPTWALRAPGDLTATLTTRLGNGNITHNGADVGLNITNWFDGTYSYVGDPNPAAVAPSVILLTSTVTDKQAARTTVGTLNATGAGD